MAKKSKEIKVEEPVVEETGVMEEPKVETPKIKKEVKSEPKKNKWEIKDRIYYLKGKKKPLSHSIKTSNLYWFYEGFVKDTKQIETNK